MQESPDKGRNDRSLNTRSKEAQNGLVFLSQMGIHFAVCVIIGLFIGYNLDRYLVTSPWLTLLFTFLGLGAAFKSLFDMGLKKWS